MTISKSQIAAIESLVNSRGSINDPVHDNDHLRRVAKGAAWFVKMSGGSVDDQKTAYAAGLLHDIIRPKMEKAEGHEIASANMSRKILSRLKVDDDTTKQIVEAITNHRAPTKWNSVIHESVFFADKVFELMGPLILFRRCTWVGGCKELHKGSVTDSLIEQFEIKIKKHRPSHFNKSFRALVNEQYAWPVRFLRALRADDAWALYMGAAGFSNGAHTCLPLHAFVKKFKPIEKKDAEVRNETMKYLNGLKWNEWAALIKK